MNSDGRKGESLEILVARSAGFCFGVKRAIKLANTCAENKEGGIFTLGPIIHNPQEVKRLEESRIFAKESIDEIGSGTVIIRSHGVKVEDLDAARKKGLNVVDATCPFVKKAQDLVSLLTQEGYFVVLVGEKDHPEVKGLVSYGRGKVMVAASAEELRGMPGVSRIGIVAQTTVPIERFEEVVRICLNRAQELKIFNTICNATSIRQRESVELAAKVDCMIVVGGRNSANTRRLAELCASIQPRTFHIEVSRELDPGWFVGVRRVGVTAGASTPDWIIEDVVARIGSFTPK